MSSRHSLEAQESFLGQNRYWRIINFTRPHPHPPIDAIIPQFLLPGAREQVGYHYYWTIFPMGDFDCRSLFWDPHQTRTAEMASFFVKAYNHPYQNRSNHAGWPSKCCNRSRIALGSSCPSSFLYSCRTIVRINRRGARRPVNNSNWANPCSGSTSRPSKATHPRWDSDRICFIRGVFRGL